MRRTAITGVISLVPFGIVCCGLLTDTARAQFTPAWTWNRHNWFVTTTGAVTTTRGWEFTVTQPLTITAIGVFDEETSFALGGSVFYSFPGLARPHDVALWNVTNTTTPLAEGLVSSGSSTPLCQDGYRYAPIPPTLLMPGNNYVVSAFWPSDAGQGNFDPYPDLQSSGAPVTIDPRVTLVQSRYLLFSMPNQFPSSIGGGPSSHSYTGLLNFRIGEGGCEPNPAAGLETTFRGGNGQAGNMFDLRALNPAGLTVTGWQINLGNDVTNATPITVRIYWRAGSHAGHESTPDGWNLLGVTQVLSWGVNQRTPVPLGGLALPANETIGVLITTDFITSQPPPASPPFLHYTNMPPGTPTQANADLEVTSGVGKANPLFTGATFFAKQWNGGVVYSVGAGCYADCNGSGALTIADFACFQGAFVAGDPYADCNQSGGLTIADFSCFQAEFAAGCP